MLRWRGLPGQAKDEASTPPSSEVWSGETSPDTRGVLLSRPCAICETDGVDPAPCPYMGDGEIEGYTPDEVKFNCRLRGVLIAHFGPMSVVKVSDNERVRRTFARRQEPRREPLGYLRRGD